MIEGTVHIPSWLWNSVLALQSNKDAVGVWDTWDTVTVARHLFLYNRSESCGHILYNESDLF